MDNTAISSGSLINGDMRLTGSFDIGRWTVLAQSTATAAILRTTLDV